MAQLGSIIYLARDNPKNNSMLRNFWKRKINFNWVFGMVLIAIFMVVRFIAVLYGIQTGNNQYLSLVFIVMALTPFLFLDKSGRRFIGIKKFDRMQWVLYAFLSGVLASTCVYVLGLILFQKTDSNWFVYIGKNYPVDVLSLSAQDKWMYFLIFSVIGATFSPFGEELLYRGVIHGSLASKFGETSAAIIDSAAFGITHLAHFGIVYLNHTWQFLPFPAVIWVVLMFLTGMVFNFCKSRSGSVWGAVVSHIGFNIAMTYFILYGIFLNSE